MPILWNDLCRLCASDQRSLLNLFNNEGECKGLIDIITKHIAVKINSEEIPCKICNECRERITSFDHFASQCERIQSMFLHHVATTVLKDHNHLQTIRSEYIDLPTHKTVKKEPTFNENSSDDFDYGQFSNDIDLDEDFMPLITIKEEGKLKLDNNHSKESNKKEKVRPRDKLGAEDEIKTEVEISVLNQWEQILDDDKQVKSAHDKSCESIAGQEVVDIENKSRKRRTRTKAINDNSTYSIFKFVCHVCQLECKSWLNLRVHVKKSHKQIAKVTCICFRTLTSSRSLLKHIAKHDPSKCVSCQKCFKVFATQKDLDTHATIHLPKSELPFVCCKCGKRFGTQKILRVHEKTHMSREERFVWPCEQCGTRFATKGALGTHVKVIHQKLRPFVCDLCGHACSTKSNLEEHHARHGDEKNFQCEQCLKRFKTKGALQRHSDTHGGTAYACPHCPMLLNSRRTLRNHLFVHDDAARHSCPFCGKTFKRRKDINCHLKLHTGERPYSCPWCSRTFANGSNCRIHKRRMHPAEFQQAEANNPYAPCNVAKSPPKKVIHTTINVQPTPTKSEDSSLVMMAQHTEEHGVPNQKEDTVTEVTKLPHNKLLIMKSENEGFCEQ